MIDLIQGECIEQLRKLPEQSVHTCVTSPPYWGLRDYGHEDQIGLEETPEEFVAKIVEVFREVHRVLRDDGTLWVNMGDCYVSSPGGRKNTDEVGGKQETNKGSRSTPSRSSKNLKPKNLVGIPWEIAFALRADGWYLRQDIIWSKPNPMPESVQDRCTKSHEYIFLLSKSPVYYYDSEAISEPADPKNWRNSYTARRCSPPGSTTDTGFANGREYETRNKRSVWTVTVKPFNDAHFATFPPDLIEPCILAGCPENGVVLDPFAGSGTTGLVAYSLRRNAILIELVPEYFEMAGRRIKDAQRQQRLF